MLEPQNTSAYRIALALSLAFCLHVVLFLVIDQWPETPPPDEPRVVEVRLTQPGTDQQTEDTRADSGPGEPETDADTTDEPETATEPVVTTKAPSPPEPETDRDTEQRPSGASAPARSEGEKAPTTDSLARILGDESTPETEEDDAPVAQMDETEQTELSEYELGLWQAIAQEVRYHDLLAELEEVKEVTLSLRLMPNGALEGASIEQSSGRDTLDSIARQAALAASPYPEPPDNSQRFTVRLRFTPDGAGR